MSLDLLAIASGLGITILSVLSQLSFWQRKEYRWDRMRAFVESPEGKLARHPLLVLFVGCVGVAWLGYLTNRLQVAAWFGWAALISIGVYHLVRIRRQGVLRPQWTTKARLIALMLAVFTGMYWRWFLRNGTLIPLHWATLIFFLPPAAAIATGLVNIPAALVKRKIITQAQARRAGLSKLTVIGITGSWGKTSTKHFLQQLLADCGKKVAATKAHRNEEFMVAQDMMEQLTDDVDIYIAEMGAYREGEIAALTRLTQPAVGVITAIGNQHLDLFGSKENIARAKWELIDGLPPTGIAVLNGDDSLLRERAKKLDRRIVWFSTQAQGDVKVTDVNLRVDATQATLWIGSESKVVTIPVVSEGMLASVVAAVAAAHAAGIATQHLFKQVLSLSAYEHTMQVRPGKDGATIIDDSYSASEAAVLNALRHLQRFPQPDKRVVIVPIIELGEEGPSVHQKIGRELTKIGAKVYIYGTEYREDILDGAGSSAHITWITDPRELVEKATKNLTDKSVILLEGRVPAVIRKALEI